MLGAKKRLTTGVFSMTPVTVFDKAVRLFELSILEKFQSSGVEKFYWDLGENCIRTEWMKTKHGLPLHHQELLVKQDLLCSDLQRQALLMWWIDNRRQLEEHLVASNKRERYVESPSISNFCGPPPNKLRRQCSDSSLSSRSSLLSMTVVDAH